MSSSSDLDFFLVSFFLSLVESPPVSTPFRDLRLFALIVFLTDAGDFDRGDLSLSFKSSDSTAC